MAVTDALASLGRLIRRSPPPSVDDLEAYAHEVVPVLDRAEWLYQFWLEQSSLFTDSEKLGNVAAIHGWETAKMGRSLHKVVPPRVLARPHVAVIDALDLASRAAQLLSKGSRFHNASAVCEGQAMLIASRERRLAALRSMRRYLLLVPPIQPAEMPADRAARETAATQEPDAALALVTDPQASGQAALADSAAPTSPTDLAPTNGLPAEPGTGLDDALLMAPSEATAEATAEADHELSPIPSFLIAAPSATPAAPPVSTPGPGQSPPGVPTEPPGAASSPSAPAPTSPSPAGADTPEPPARSGWGGLFGRSGGGGGE